MKGLEQLLAEHAFFAGMEPKDLALIAGCGANARFEAGDYLFREGEPADQFYLLRSGRVVVEVHDPARGTITVLSAGEGEVLGFSWLMPPYRWVFDARALELTRALVFDGACLRDKCEADARLGYDLLKRVTSVMMQRLEAASVQLLDVYGGAAAR
ncbi:MAG: cyclic nucleotide-binding domain-containing protein [Candidatus Palauibacterales bacterium]|nr:cyclic nucleotide-binding domain-containing protein [Candidatus Palauibacterales bacterium]MDP2584411.1 cyclic nucleotide-binding domain-containing protein [Candidatus Palauibacterales bacterium]